MEKDVEKSLERGDRSKLQGLERGKVLRIISKVAIVRSLKVRCFLYGVVFALSVDSFVHGHEESSIIEKVIVLFIEEMIR